MKARIIKKLSKKVKEILPKDFKESWVDVEVMEEAWEQGSKVSHCVMVGGELDYWGEGTDYFSAISVFADSLIWRLDLPQHPAEHEFEGLPDCSKMKRLTGQYMITAAKDLALKQLNKGNR